MRRFFFLLCLSIHSQLWAAVAVDTTTTATGVGVVSLGWTHVITGSNVTIVCALDYDSGGSSVDDITSFTYNSVELTTTTNLVVPTGAVLDMRYGVAPATGSHSVSIAHTSSANDVGSCTSFTGAHQTTPIGTAVTATDPSVGVAITVPANGMGYDTVTDNYGVGCETITKGASQTSRFNLCNGDNTINSAGSTIASSVTMTWTGGTGYLAQIGVPISQAAAAATAVRHRSTQ